MTISRDVLRDTENQLKTDNPSPAIPATANPQATQHKVAFVPPADTLTPADRYKELFIDVQTSRVFGDSKVFVDCVPKGDPDGILSEYRLQKPAAGFDLATFVHAHFDLPVAAISHYVSDPGQSLSKHIDSLWPVLTRKPEEHPPHSSLLPLPNPYVVPGGRFTELYYWDSYFTMLGLVASGRKDLLHAMADNFAYLIDTYGLIPNGTRTYYLSRSQPPVFALMVELFESHGVKPAAHYLPQLRKEYAFWMDGADALQAGEAYRHVVRLPDGEVLNRYWDDRETPREESFIEDVTTAGQSDRTPKEVYRDLRAAAASGWDFSSRWLDASGELHSIRTTAILPIDLNCFLFKLESKIAQLSEAGGDAATAADFARKAGARKDAITQTMWNEEAGAFFDFDWRLKSMRPNLTAATATPLYVQLASHAQAGRLAATIAARLLEDGGLATTENAGGQQWDQPNGWAPLQWLAIAGLTRYGQAELAHDIANRWLKMIDKLYRREGKLVEKYVLRFAENEAVVGGDGGEYPLQDGFGWTNGVTRKLLETYALE